MLNKNASYPVPGLHSDGVRSRLDQIDQVRSQGIGDCISWPQLVVCGDQSSGKSSVLTGVTGFPFPRQEGTCTRFATEIVLRHSQEVETIRASIIPSLSRRDGTEIPLRKFQKTLSSTRELPLVVKEAARLMGIRGHWDADGDDAAPAFAADVLRVEITGDTGVSLTVVDLPGLISVSEKDEEDSDLELINDLVDGYLKNTSSIVLAVVQATDDIQKQRVIKRARSYDTAGERTIGIITKLDLLSRKTEPQIARLANYIESTRLRLGYFILKNPSPEHLKRGISMDEWKQEDVEFFRSRLWKDLGLRDDRVGVETLRAFIEIMLEEHIEREIPKVCDEIQAFLAQTRASISELGDERSSVAEQRKYLLRASMEYMDLIRAGLDGRYREVDPHFFENAPSQAWTNRLRAHVQDLNVEFATYMRDRGEKRKISPKDGGGAENFSQHRGALPEPVSEAKFYSWVKQVYENTRGLELPGSHNHVFLSELFHEQSSRWPVIASLHLRRVHHKTIGFAHRALHAIIKDKHITSEVLKIINTRLDENLKSAQEELEKICADEKTHPMTYSHYYTDTIRKARASKLMGLVRNALDNASLGEVVKRKGESGIDVERLLARVDRHLDSDMDKDACEWAIDALDAYYKLSMKTFVDNITRQVIERHILGQLHQVFHPTQVGTLPDERVRRIASESPQTTEKRQELKGLAAALESSLELLSDGGGVQSV